MRTEQIKRVISGEFTLRLNPETNLKDENPAHQQHQGLDNAPHPPAERTDITPIKIPADELIKQLAAGNQILKEERTGKAHDAGGVGLTSRVTNHRG